MTLRLRKIFVMRISRLTRYDGPLHVSNTTTHMELLLWYDPPILTEDWKIYIDGSKVIEHTLYHVGYATYEIR